MIYYPVEIAYQRYCNESFVCPSCGLQWARLQVNKQSHWIFTLRDCETCPQTWTGMPPGSLIDWPAATHIDGHGSAHLPREALLREINLYAPIDVATERAHNTPTIPNERPQMTTNLESQIAHLRSKILNNTATDEELREGLRALRAERYSASERRVVTKAASAPVDGAALLAKLIGRS